MKIRAVFFDAGNTLLVPDPPVEHVYGQAFARFGVERSDPEVRQALRATWAEVRQRRNQGEEHWNGNGGEAAFWHRFVSRIFARLGGGPLPDELLASLITHFGQTQHWAVYPEVHGVLGLLRQSGYNLHVVSNWDSTLPGLLRRLELDGAFDSIVVSALVGSSKPDPGIFREALLRAGVEPGEALHIGDSRDEDYDGAIAAGLHALLLDREGISRGNEGTISSLEEIPQHLERMASS